MFKSIIFSCLLLIFSTQNAFAFFGSVFQNHYGEPFKDKIETVGITTLNAAPKNYKNKTILITGTIDRQCPSAGCWLFLKDTVGSTIKVELSDTFTKLPQKIGHKATVEGELVEVRPTLFLFVGQKIRFE